MNFNEYFKRIYSSPIHGDETSDSYFEPLKPITVQELCDYIISQKGDWGYIGIKKPGTIFGEPNVEYFHGQYVDNNRNPIGNFKFPPHIANATIKKLCWSGGWSRADYLITI